MIGAWAHLPQMIPTPIECAWPYLGGMPKHIVCSYCSQNMKLQRF